MKIINRIICNISGHKWTEAKISEYDDWIGYFESDGYKCSRCGKIKEDE